MQRLTFTSSKTLLDNDSSHVVLTSDESGCTIEPERN